MADDDSMSDDDQLDVRISLVDPYFLMISMF
jgi:hypothetical protein